MPNYRRAFVPGGCWFFTVGEMTNRYAIVVFWSEEDGVWIADAPDLKSCSGFAVTGLYLFGSTARGEGNSARRSSP